MQKDGRELPWASSVPNIITPMPVWFSKLSTAAGEACCPFFDSSVSGLVRLATCMLVLVLART